jgi:alanine racemase
MNCEFLIVDSLYEAYELYKLKIKTPILIMGYTAPENFKIKPVPFHIALFDLETAYILDKFQPNCSVHIFVDTGMNREGISLNELPMFLAKIKNLHNLKVEGLCSHFADADNPKTQIFTNAQTAKFKEALQIMNDNGFSPKWRHISASGGALKLNDGTFNMIRAGLLHYGINPLEDEDKDKEDLGLQPALEFTSTLAQIKPIHKGSFVGYGCTFEAKKDTVLGLLPAGYYEGIDRRLSNIGIVKIREDYFPIVGRVSMNMTVIDITGLENPKIGEKVIVYSSNAKDKNSVEKSAKLAETIPYDLLVHFAESVRREII